MGTRRILLIRLPRRILLHPASTVGGASVGSALRCQFQWRHTPRLFPLRLIRSGISPPRFRSRAISVIAFSSRPIRRASMATTDTRPTTAATPTPQRITTRRTTITAPRILNAAQNDIAQQQQDIDRLEDEVARLREQRESRPKRATPAPQPESRSAVSTPTLLVFRDKHTQEVQNYAIVGGTLWIFSEQRATKLPLSWLDIEATTKANEDRGVNFQIPK